MALDYGSARTGVAVSDPTGMIARPLCVVERAGSEAGLAELVRLVREEEVEQVIVGLPLTLARRARRAGARDRALRRGAARASVDVPVVLYDERFTTDLAQQNARRQRPRTRARRRIFSPAVSSGGADGRLTPPGPVAAADRRPPRRRAGRARAAPGGVAAAAFAIHGSRQAAPPHDDRPPAAAVPHRLPRGIHARADGERVRAVAKIAERERHRKVKLSRSGYLAATARKRVDPGFGAKKLPLEGFLFPDTYDFDRKHDVGGARAGAARRRSTRSGARSTSRTRAARTSRRTTC